MVVNGGCIHSLVIPYSNHVDLTKYPSMAGKAVLICRPNSHPFVDRTLVLEQPVKIGRSVARARASQTNGIFDCKVLSRNHALIWYSNGKFYLQDTKSSNGTFVNNQRLSKSGEESLPREVSSGDIVQFGVDVLENARKVTHGCIVANLKLYLPDGKEAKVSTSTSVLSGIGNVSIEDLYQLNQHIQEALQREQMLQTKLGSLQQLVLSLRQAADLGWNALIAEDRLLSRVEILENQLQTYAKNFAEDKLRDELRKLQEDKSTYQGLAKECLQKVLQEKVEAVHKCQDMESALMNAEAECANFKEMMIRDHDELQELALKHNNQYLKTVELQNKLQETEEAHKEALARLEAENEELTAEVKRLLANEAVMHEKIEQLESSTEHQLLGIQSQLQFNKSPDIHDHLSSLKERNGSTADVICKNDEDEELKDENQKDISNSMDTLVNRLTSAIEEQKRAKEVVELISAQVSLLQSEKMSKLQHVNSLEAELEIHIDKMCKYKEENRKLEQTLISLEQRLKEENMNKIDTTLIGTGKMNGSGDRLSNGPHASLDSLAAQIEDIKEAQKESRSKMEAMERTIELLQLDLSNAKKNFSENTKNWLLQDEKLQEAQSLKEEADKTVNVLREQLKVLENSLLQIKLQEKYESETEHINKHKEEATLLRKQLQEAQQAAKQNKNETELVKEKLRAVTEELEMARSLAEAKSDSQLDNKAAEELAAARLEAASLHTQVLSLESQIKKLKLESSQKQQELLEANQTGTISDDLETTVQKFRLRISELEEELVMVKEKYMACNEKNTQLGKELTILKQDYDAVVHQPYFGHNHHYLLGVVVTVVIAILLSLGLYPYS